MKDKSWFNRLLIAFPTIILFTNKFRQQNDDDDDVDDYHYQHYYKQYEHLVNVNKMNMLQISMHAVSMLGTLILTHIHNG